MKSKFRPPMSENQAEPFVMAIADRLSDDPMLLRLIGPKFKVLVHYDMAARRVTYSFRAPGDVDPDEVDARFV